jgi:hypothetical protein
MNPQTFNRYSYCLNNPLKFIDPSGHSSDPSDYYQYYGPPSSGGGGDGGGGTHSANKDYAVSLDMVHVANGYDLINTNNDLIFHADDLNDLATYAEIYADSQGATFCQIYSGHTVASSWCAPEYYNPHQALKAYGMVIPEANIVNGILYATEGNWQKAREYAAAGIPIPIFNGAKMPVNAALEAAEQFLGKGYRDMGNGRLLSVDGTKQVLMGDSHILGDHAGGPHMNFEILEPNPAKPGKMIPKNNYHIYLEGP